MYKFSANRSGGMLACAPGAHRGGCRQTKAHDPARAAFRLSALSLALSAGLVGSAHAQTGVGVDASALIEMVTLEGVKAHEDKLQSFADAGDGTREASTNGFVDSVRYISQTMLDAGYRVSIQVFPYTFFDDLTDPVLEKLAPEAMTYPSEPTKDGEGFLSAAYSGNGDVTATAQAVDIMLPPGPEPHSSTSGCEPEDFDGFTAGNIAIVQRGECTYALKVTNAEAAGASAVVIFNEGQEGRTELFGGTLGEPIFSIPVVTTSFAIGQTLIGDDVELRVAVDTLTEIRTSANVIADTPIGDPSKTVVVGAHLDSVPDGPGINDNGSGSAGILEVALQMSELASAEGPDVIRNRLRFAWWGAEEFGLIGSDYYVNNLSEQELADISLNLNFDMIGSPNYARFVYDGDGSNSELAGPPGSAFIEWLFNDYFGAQGLVTEPTAFDGRSDYGPFIQAGIPAGGLFTGAEGIKTEEQVGLYGGTAGEAYDPCYHKVCDTIENLSDEALEQMTDAVAYSVRVFAMNDLYIPPESRGRSAVKAKSGAVMFDWDGHHFTVR